MTWWMAAGLCVALTAGCGRVGFAAHADGGSVDAAVCTAFGAWGPAVPQAALGSPGYEWGSELTEDGTHLLFDSNRDGSSDLFEATRARVGAAWSVTKSATLSSAADDSDQTLTADGLTLVFSTRRYAPGPSCLVLAERALATDTWDRWTGTVAPITALCDEGAVGGAWISDDGLRLYYHSLLDGQVLGVIRVATRLSRAGAFGPGTPVAGLDDGVRRGFVTLTRDELTAYWQQGMPLDIYTAARPSRDAPFGTATRFDAASSAAADNDASISGDGKVFTVSSSRDSNDADDFEIYQLTRECL